MISNIEVSQWGNGLAVRLNKAIVEAAHLTKGSKVSIEVDENGIHIRPTKPSKGRFTFPKSESQLLKGLTPELAHCDELAQPLLSEMGEP